MIKFKEISIYKKSPFLLFLPFLIFYILIVLRFHSNELYGDEPRYIYFANNLIHGFYSTPAPDINLWNGPGYPILLMPFIAFNIPTLFILILNAFFYYFSIVLLYKTLIQFSTKKMALIICVFWAFYFNAYQDLLLRCTEVFTFFLISLLLFLVFNIFNEKNNSKNKYILLAGFTLGYLVLTKIIFAYVVIIFLAGSIILYFISKAKNNYKKTIFVLLIAFVTISPYLMYTYSLTGKIFYLGNSGGMSLYWMSNPNSGEYGDWFDEDYFSAKPMDEKAKLAKKSNFMEIYQANLKANHQKDFDEIFKFSGAQRDSVYKQIAIRNIKENPKSFFVNYISNIGRLFFSYPFSYTLQTNKTLFRIPFSGLLLFLSLFLLIPTIINWKRLIFPLKFFLIFLLLYLGASSLLSAYTRMFTVVVPLVLFWIAYTLPKTVIRKKTDDFTTDHQ
jgi:hypothetical protein